jgi:hypothetical protein
VDSPLSRRGHQSISEKCRPKLRAWVRTSATNICGPNLAQCFSLLNENEQKYCQLAARLRRETTLTIYLRFHQNIVLF